MKPAYKKSWDGNLLMWSDLTLDPSFKVKRGQQNLIAYHLLIIGPIRLQCETNYGKSWAGNLLRCARSSLLIKILRYISRVTMVVYHLVVI